MRLVSRYYSLYILGLAPPCTEEGSGFRLMDTSTPLPNDDVDGYHMLTNAVAMALRSVGVFFLSFSSFFLPWSLFFFLVVRFDNLLGLQQYYYSLISVSCVLVSYWMECYKLVLS
jgi:hypothetical protein